MDSKQKKSSILFYKKCSKIYGRLSSVSCINNRDHIPLNIKFSNQNTAVNKFKYNQNSKKILESKESNLLNFNELTSVLINADNLLYLKDEIKRSKFYVKKFGKFSIFKDEIEHVPLKSITYFSFYSKKRKEKDHKNFSLDNSFSKNFLLDFIPLVIDDDKSNKKISCRFFCSSKIIPILTFGGNTFHLFKKISAVNLRAYVSSGIKWLFPSGIVFKCPVIFTIIYSDLCEISVWSKKKIDLFLQFCFFFTFFLKSIIPPTNFFIKRHTKLQKKKKDFISNNLICFKKKSNRSFLDPLEDIFHIASAYVNIEKFSKRYFLRFIWKKYSQLFSIHEDEEIKNFFLNFYAFPVHKSALRTIELKPFVIIEKIGKIKYLKKLAKFNCFNIFSDLRFFTDYNFLLSHQNILSHLKNMILFINNNNVSNHVSIFAKLENNNIDIAVYSTKNYIGLNLRINIFNAMTFIAYFPIKVAAEWGFYRKSLSMGKSGEEIIKVTCLPVDTNLFKNLRLTIKTKKTNVTEQTPFNKTNNLFEYLYGIKFLNKSSWKRFRQNYFFNFKLRESIFNFYNSNNFSLSKYKIRFFLESSNKQTLYFKKCLFSTLIMNLSFSLKSNKNNLKVSKKFRSILQDKKQLKQLFFCQRIYFEASQIFTYYRKNKTL